MKKFKVITAIILVAIMSLSLWSCDLSNEVIDADAAQTNEAVSESTTAATEKPDGDTTTEAPEPPLVDSTLENQAKTALADDFNITVINDTTIDMTMYGSKTTTVSQSKQMINGSNIIQQTTENDGSNIEYTELIQIGSDFYITYEDSTHPETTMLVKATDADIKAAEEQLGAKDKEVLYSINDFMTVVRTENADDSITYTCTGLRPSAEAKYNQLFCAAIAMISPGSSAKIDRDTMKYEVTFKDGKYVSCNIDMTLDAFLVFDGDSISVIYEYDIEETYTYGDVPEISAPTDFVADQTYTWEEYWALVQNSISG